MLWLSDYYHNQKSNINFYDMNNPEHFSQEGTQVEYPPGCLLLSYRIKCLTKFWSVVIELVSHTVAWCIVISRCGSAGLASRRGRWARQRAGQCIPYRPGSRTCATAAPTWNGTWWRALCKEIRLFSCPWTLSSGKDFINIEWNGLEIYQHVKNT